MDQAVRDSATPLEDDFLDLYKDLLLRLLLNENLNTATGYVNNSKKDKDATKDAKNNKDIKECSYCHWKSHEESCCWDKYLEKRLENLRKASTVEPVNTANAIEEQCF
ncbi:hypothetical protein EMPG_13071 [Blastomyces silverae]|uniref:Uncharacterized protein n=1 Tax=Blastomyces silverae TaxID=2060906 RepID=A0A0H1BKX1_9EURO|nr:hypothetical protein EMPG_13071 [Blastomyces silverae]